MFLYYQIQLTAFFSDRRAGLWLVYRLCDVGDGCSDRHAVSLFVFMAILFDLGQFGEYFYRHVEGVLIAAGINIVFLDFRVL